MPEARATKTGFAGLEDLVSPLVLPNAPTASPSPVPAAAALPEKPVGRVRWGRVTLLCAGLIFVGFLIVQNDQESSSAPAPPAARPLAPPVASPAVTSTPAPDPWAVAPSTGAESFEEAKPQAGTDRLLQGAELNYCIAQGARIDEWNTLVDATSEMEVSGFNRMISDYNSRCAKFRYYKDELARVRAEVAARKEEFLRQAQRLHRRYQSASGTPATGTP